MLNRSIIEDVELKKHKIKLKETQQLIALSGGDARKLLNLFEIIINIHSNQKEIIVTDELVKASAQKSVAMYDKNGEMHYDIISAFIKSVRGSDPNAAIYWLARMIEGGEDPKFIARRLVILAAEDIGLANPNGIIMANAAFNAIDVIGWPEGRIVLAQCVIYLATSPKGNAAYMAINKAQDLVRKTGNLSVPLALRNAPTKLMKELGYGEEYKYSHNYTNNFINQEFMPDEITGTNFFENGSSTREKEIMETIRNLWGEKYG